MNICTVFEHDSHFRYIDSKAKQRYLVGPKLYSAGINLVSKSFDKFLCYEAMQKLWQWCVSVVRPVASVSGATISLFQNQPMRAQIRFKLTNHRPRILVIQTILTIHWNNRGTQFLPTVETLIQYSLFVFFQNLCFWCGYANRFVKKRIVF